MLQRLRSATDTILSRHAALVPKQFLNVPYIVPFSNKWVAYLTERLASIR